MFTGKDEVFKLIGALFRRPRFRDRARSLVAYKWERIPQRRDRVDRTGLPMVNLVRANGPSGLLTEVREYLKAAKPNGVRCAYVRCAKTTRGDGPAPDGRQWTEEDISAVRGLLREARNGLLDNSGVRGRRLRFPLFTLADWLMKQNPKSVSGPDRDRELRGLLRGQSLAARFNRGARAAQQELPSGIKWKLPIWIMRCVVGIFFWAAVTGRVRVLSGRYWWFMHQPHLAPQMASTFVRFAGRLVNGERRNEAHEYVARLLLNAFLEDLRREYRLRPWHLFRRRRMTYPVLLIDDISRDNGGYDLLYLINQVRNQVGTFDPLLVVSAGQKRPPDDEKPPADGGKPKPDDGKPAANDDRNRNGPPDRAQTWYPAAEASLAFDTWQNQLLNDRRARRDNTWYLPLLVPGPPTGDAERAAANRWGAFKGYDAVEGESRPPALTSVWLRVGMTAIVLAGAAGSTLYVHNARCGSWDSGLRWTGSECVGVTDGSIELFQPSDGPIRQVEQAVLGQNKRAETMHRDFPARPYITLVDLQAITSADRTADGLTAEREGLEGVAVAQRRQLNKSGSSDPIVRVLIANAGNGMYQGAAVARQLRDMAARDPSLVGVVGLDMSSSPTASTITALSDSGLPSVASTLSEDTLASGNPMYFQVAPRNQREAAMVLAFAKYRLAHGPERAKSVRVYYSDDTADSYSLNLRDDVMSAFAADGFRTSATAFTPSSTYGVPGRPQPGDNLIGTASAAGRDTCDYDGFAFFAGRGVPDYGDFLSGSEQCPNTDKAVFIGDDDVSRYVANASLRSQYSQPYHYVSFAPDPIASPPGVERDFYNSLRRLFSFEYLSGQGSSLDGHAALSYDAALVMITATQYLREGPMSIPVTPGNVWREITDIHSARAVQPGASKAINGATGVIDYGGDIARHVPMNKPIAVLRVTGGKVNKDIEGFCGVAAGRKPSAWCPSGG